jgi:GTP pyrophosphokinase
LSPLSRTDLNPKSNTKQKQQNAFEKDAELIIFGESSDRLYTRWQLCKPIPGDDVFGFVSSGKA